MKTAILILLAAGVTGFGAVAYANSTIDYLVARDRGAVVLPQLQSSPKTTETTQPAARINLQYKTNAVTLQASDGMTEFIQPAID